MTDFNVHTIETAPEESRATLEGAKEAFGFLPNLLGILAESPTALEGYLEISKIFGSSDFSDTEQQVILLAASVDNGCDYCVAAHSTIAKMQGVSEDVVEAIRDDREINDSKLETLRSFTTSVVSNRGWVPEADVNSFLSAGYSKRQLLDVIVGVTQKTLSNYVNHIASTPVDAKFEKEAWSKETASV